MGKIETFAAPQHIALACHHSHNLRLEVFVAMKGHFGGKLPIGAHFRKFVGTTEFRERGVLYEFHQLALLHGIGIIFVAQLLIEPRHKVLACYRCEIYHHRKVTAFS